MIIDELVVASATSWRVSQWCAGRQSDHGYAVWSSTPASQHSCFYAFNTVHDVHHGYASTKRELYGISYQLVAGSIPLIDVALLHWMHRKRRWGTWSLDTPTREFIVTAVTPSTKWAPFQCLRNKCLRFHSVETCCFLFLLCHARRSPMIVPTSTYLVIVWMTKIHLVTTRRRTSVGGINLRSSCHQSTSRALGSSLYKAALANCARVGGGFSWAQNKFSIQSRR